MIYKNLQDVKGDSSKWINKRGLVTGKFSWQAGYGAFSYSYSQIDKVLKYIKNQKQHHKKKTFREEYSVKVFLYLQIEFQQRILKCDLIY